VGDLDVTCRSVHGRNRRFGREIILKDLLRGFASIDEVIASMPRFGYYAEGVVTAKWVHAIAAQRKLSLPIIGGVYSVLNMEVAPPAAVRGMLERITLRTKKGKEDRAATGHLRGTVGLASRLSRRG
jgi:glycerol-3-phosphate dehydrogenase (NAD(P)+)